jgi:hypothetical protein
MERFILNNTRGTIIIRLSELDDTNFKKKLLSILEELEALSKQDGSEPDLKISEESQPSNKSDEDAFYIELTKRCKAVIKLMKDSPKFINPHHKLIIDSNSYELVVGLGNYFYRD